VKLRFAAPRQECKGSNRCPAGSSHGRLPGPVAVVENAGMDETNANRNPAPPAAGCRPAARLAARADEAGSRRGICRVASMHSAPMWPVTVCATARNGHGSCGMVGCGVPWQLALGYAMLAHSATPQSLRARPMAWSRDLRATQDSDGYIGIHAAAARFRAGEVENGELWAQSRALFVLLAAPRIVRRPSEPRSGTERCGPDLQQ